MSRAISDNMRQTLCDIARGLDPFHRCYGRSEHGGQTRVLGALVKRGLLSGDGASQPWRLTSLGQAAITAAWAAKGGE